MPTTTDAKPLRRQGNRIVAVDEYVDADDRKREARKRWSDRRKVTRREESKFAQHKFVCFDGEGFEINGSHQYVYLACYNGERYSAIRNDTGLQSSQCFHFLIAQAKQNPKGISIIYGGSYDANMMLRDVSPSCLAQIRERNWTIWRQYRIEYVPWKFFQITDQEQKITCRIWDVIGFFQMSFVAALQQWLGINSAVINKGKAKRSKFTADDIDNIIDYCKEELHYFEQLAQHLWQCLDAINMRITRWDGAGAIAQCGLTMYGIFEFKGTKENFLNTIAKNNRMVAA